MESNENKGLSRRSFLTAASVSILSIPVLGKILSSVAHAANALVDPAKDPVAKALKYVHKAPDDKAKAKQICSTCAQYVGTGPQGKCKMIQGGEVKAEGWCASWIKKA